MPDHPSIAGHYRLEAVEDLDLFVKPAPPVVDARAPAPAGRVFAFGRAIGTPGTRSGKHCPHWRIG